jgi:hypothetical protein
VQFWDWDDIGAVPVNERTAENIYLEPGDMAIIADRQHHFVVLEIGADRRSLLTMDANTSYGEINPSQTHKVAHLVSYWKPSIAPGETRFPPSLFRVPSASTTPKAPLSALVGEWKVTTGGVDYYYKFEKNKTVTWSTTRGGNEGAGRVWSTGGGWAKVAWKSGTIELWNPSELAIGSGTVTGTYYYHANTTSLTATRL